MKKQKVHSLTGRITPDLMMAAFKAVKRNRGAAGVDKVSIKMFEANLDDNLRGLMRDLKQGTFQPKPLRRVFIPKNETEVRPLGIPTVRDRVAQEVVRRLLAPIFEPLFHQSSFAYIRDRNAHQAVEALLDLHCAGMRVVLDADIQGFFDNLSHRVIMDAVREEVADGNILNLVEKFLKSGVMEYGVRKPTTIGTPQGGVVSPLLANIVLNYLDWQLHNAGFAFVRYADDFVVVCPSTSRAEEARVFVESVLDKLGLKLSPSKTKIVSFGKGYSFLGFIISSRSRRMRPKSVKKFKDKVRELTRRKHNFDAEVIEKLNRVIGGTARYFATSFFTGRSSFHKLDSWIRMRLRCMKFKRKSRHDNHKLRVKSFTKLGLLSLESFCPGHSTR
ncbi:MAG TPA: group II intron reverse transcriptase/maturase [Terriglobales bacterium]|nr:group II intron reverse transcriptase/maturase [Terriglobales bacterium]